MAQPGRQIPSHIRHPSMPGSSNAQSGASPILVARINEKKQELENLKQLRELSAQLADQMQMLQEKLATLTNGTEAVAAVLSNWHNVLRAINMASMKIPQPKTEDHASKSNNTAESETPLPQTLVRIPVDQTLNAANQG